MNARTVVPRLGEASSCSCRLKTNGACARAHATKSKKTINQTQANSMGWEVHTFPEAKKNAKKGRSRERMQHQRRVLARNMY